jgi:hypothetical protein
MTHGCMSPYLRKKIWWDPNEITLALHLKNKRPSGHIAHLSHIG